MKMKQIYISSFLITAMFVLAMSIGTSSFAQSTTPLTCSVGASIVSANQVAILTATGGNGSYTWSGQNIDITNTHGNQFAVSYPNAGTYTITVTSGNQSAICSVNFGIETSAGNLVCSPSVQTVRLGQPATFSVTGGTGTY